MWRDRYSDGRAPWADSGSPLMENPAGKDPGLVVLALAALAVLVAFDAAPRPWVVSTLVLAAAAYLYLKRSPAAPHALFFLVLSLTLFVFKVPSFWLFNVLLALAAYGVLILAIPGLRENTSWLNAGLIDRATLAIVAVVSALGVAGLLGWGYFTGTGFGHYQETIPTVGPVLLATGILGFSVFNALSEELIFRGILWDGFERAGGGPALVLVLQAALFGVSHWKGVPSGASGVGLAAVYGLMLGYLKRRSGGLMAPFLAHVTADLAISLIVLWAIGRL